MVLQRACLPNFNSNSMFLLSHTSAYLFRSVLSSHHHILELPLLKWLQIHLAILPPFSAARIPSLWSVGFKLSGTHYLIQGHNWPPQTTPPLRICTRFMCRVRRLHRHHREVILPDKTKLPVESFQLSSSGWSVRWQNDSQLHFIAKLTIFIDGINSICNCK